MSYQLHQLRSPKGSRKNTKRLGRGIGSGQGKTAGKGHKGQKARSGGGKPRFGFEGGQTPLIRRLPKFGFNNRFRIPYNIVSLKKLADLGIKEMITPQILKEKSIVRQLRYPIKVLNSGDFKPSFGLKIHLHAISEPAKKLLESADGSFQEFKE